MNIVELFESHEGKTADKWYSYLEEYDRLFLPYKDKDISLLEIGVSNGGSLEIWAKYFENAESIIGVDINPSCGYLVFDDPRIAVVVRDINSINVWEKKFDIIIDDGSHKSEDVIISFRNNFSRLKDGGIYVVEDMHCSYFDVYKTKGVSSIVFFKALIDVVNHEYSSEARVDLLNHFSSKLNIGFDELDLARIHSVEFINSLCVVRKMPPYNNVLGSRVIVGTQDFVRPSRKERLDGIFMRDMMRYIK